MLTITDNTRHLNKIENNKTMKYMQNLKMKSLTCSLTIYFREIYNQNKSNDRPTHKAKIHFLSQTSLRMQGFFPWTLWYGKCPRSSDRKIQWLDKLIKEPKMFINVRPKTVHKHERYIHFCSYFFISAEFVIFFLKAFEWNYKA